jgi:hypothetical protein
MWKIIKKIARKTMIFCIIFMMLFSNFPVDFLAKYIRDFKVIDQTYLGKNLESSLKDFQTPEAKALSQFTPTNQFYNAATTTLTANSSTSMRSYRGALASDNVYFQTANIANQALEVGVNIGNVALNGANKIIVTSETANVTTTRNYFVQICDWTSSIGVNNAADANCTGGGWRTINNPRTTALNSITEAAYTYEIFDGYFYTAVAPGTKISTPLTNFVSSGNLRIRYLGASNASAIEFRIDRVLAETAIDPVYYPAAYVPISPFAGTTSNFYASNFAANNTRQSVTNTSGNAMNFYYSFQNIQTYTGANTILVNYEGAYVSATALTYNLAIYNFNSSGWEDLHTGAITASATSTDQVNQFAKNNVTLSNYISSGEVRIRIYSTVTGTQTFQSDMIAITVGSVNTDVAQSETSFGQETGGTTATNTRDLDVLTTSTAGNTWQHATCLNNAIAGACTAVTYPYAADWAGTWGTNYSSASNVSVPITVPTDASVTGVRFAARFRSNVSTNAVQLGIKDYSGQFAGPTIAGGWSAVGTANNATTFIFTDGIYQVNPEDHIDTVNNRGNLRLRTSTSTATATITRAWDFAFMSIRYVYQSGGVTPAITVGTTGTQTATMNIPSTNQSVGGAFTMIRNTSSANVTGITITETGTVSANTGLNNVKLYYDTTNCTYEGTEPQYGSTTTFNASAKASFTGSVAVGTSQVCFYVLTDVTSSAVGGDTLEIQIADPSTEVIASAGSMSPASAVSISGTTTLNVGSLVSDIVDGSGNPIASPSISFSSGLYTWNTQQSTGTLGIAVQKIRVSNTTGTPSWTISLAATNNTNRWTSGGNTYDFNDSAANGRMNVDPSVSTITPQSGCNNTGLTKGTSTYFAQGTQDSVNLVIAGGSAGTNCYWDITGVNMTQDVPATQVVGSYALDMTLTII